MNVDATWGAASLPRRRLPIEAAHRVLTAAVPACPGETLPQNHLHGFLTKMAELTPPDRARTTGR